MSELQLRASDAERERTVALLRDHSAEGRLTLEEFSQRMERAYAATTRDELDQLTRDLPVRPETLPARPRRRAKRFTGVVFGHTERKGRWRLARFGLIGVLFGDADIDLRRAEVGHRAMSLTAFVLFGNVDFYVPEQVEVDLGGLFLFGHRREWGEDPVPHPETPLLRIRVFSLFGTADVWRVPAEWTQKGYREVIKALRGRRALGP